MEERKKRFSDRSISLSPLSPPRLHARCHCGPATPNQGPIALAATIDPGRAGNPQSGIQQSVMSIGYAPALNLHRT